MSQAIYYTFSTIPQVLAATIALLGVFAVFKIQNIHLVLDQLKADIDFEKELWTAANELRGAVAENQYKDYVLPLITQAVKKNLQLDWFKKENARAAIRLAVKKQLRGKADIKALNEILAEIMEQAEGQYKEWPMVG